MQDETRKPKRWFNTWVPDFLLDLLGEMAGCIVFPVVAIVVLGGAFLVGGVPWLAIAVVAGLVVLLLVVIGYVFMQVGG